MIRTQGVDRRLLYWVAGKIYAERTAVFPTRDALERVLLVRVDERVGNLIMMQSLLDAVKTRLPAARVGLWASARMQRVTETLEGLDWLHEIDKRWFFRCPWRWSKAIRTVRGMGYQVAVDASAWHAYSLTHAVLTHFSGAPMRIGYQRDPVEQCNGKTLQDGFHTHLVHPGPSDEQELRQHMRLLAPLGVHTEPPVLRTSLGGEQIARWKQWLEMHIRFGLRIGIWAGARKTERRWDHDNFVQVGRKLHQEMNAGLLVLWGPGEEQLRGRLLDGFKPYGVATPDTTLSELAGIMRGLDLVVTNDTGPMHLAVAVGTPTLVLFPSGEPKRWGHGYSFVKNLDVSGGDADCHMDAIMDACRRLLEVEKQSS